jgi:hypothetical protein
VLKVEGSFVLKEQMTFDVVGDGDHPGAIHFFEPTDALAGYDPKDLVGAEGVSTNQLAQRLSGKPGTPSGSDNRLANRLRQRWLKDGLVEVIDGTRGAKMMRLVVDLATSPAPRQQDGAKSVEPHLATAPIEALGGEVERSSTGSEGGEDSHLKLVKFQDDIERSEDDSEDEDA